MSQQVTNLTELKEYWSNFNGLIFPYLLIKSTKKLLVRYGALPNETI